MPMMLLQMQFTNIIEQERHLIPKFCEWLCSIIYSDVNTKINRKKISLRINYILDSVNWVNWNKDKYNLNVNEIMTTIQNAIDYEEYKNNTWKIIINSNFTIPHSNTSIDRLVRFLNYGDNKQRATGIFNIEQKYNFKELNKLWQLFLMRNLGNMTLSKIISR